MQYCELMFSKNTTNGQFDGRIKSRLSFRDKRLYYKISAEPRCFSDDGFLNALKSHSGQIAAADGVLAIARPVIEPLLFDASDFLKHCAFSGLLRYLKGILQ